MKTVNGFITKHLIMLKRSDEIVTSVVMDEESFNVIWDELERLNLINQLDGQVPDPEFLAKIRGFKRIPLVQRTENTKTLFEALNIETEKFCGIVRGASNVKMVL